MAPDEYSYDMFVAGITYAGSGSALYAIMHSPSLETISYTRLKFNSGKQKITTVASGITFARESFIDNVNV